MTLALPQENVLDIQNKRMQLTALAKTTITELIKLLEKLSFTAQAVLPGKIGTPQLIPKTNAFKRGWRGGGGRGWWWWRGTVCHKTTTGKTWSYQERTKLINVLELNAVKLAILTFTEGKSVTAIHL